MLHALPAGAEARGWPALFLPSNAGSHKQVRSLASETAQRAAAAERSGTDTDVAWYTVDTREELSAFVGALPVSCLACP
jgi:glycosylphosphatidylinositol deacylase